MGMLNNKFYQKENEKILYYGRRQIFDYVRVDHKIIFLVDGYKIIEQNGTASRILYENNGEAISQLTYKNDSIIFLEANIFKKIIFDNIVEEIINCEKRPSDFCIL
jgi:hypothetical protein